MDLKKIWSKITSWVKSNIIFTAIFFGIMCLFLLIRLIGNQEICCSYLELIWNYCGICAVLFLAWHFGGRRKSKESHNGTDQKVKASFNGDPPKRKDLYNAAIQLIVHAENMTWTRSSNFLLANSIVMLAWATIFASEWGDERKAAFLSLLSLLGFVLSLAWAPFSYRGRRYLYEYARIGKQLEQDLPPPLRDGPLNADENLEFTIMEKLAKSRYLVIFIPLSFAAVFLAALMKSLCLFVTC